MKGWGARTAPSKGARGGSGPWADWGSTRKWNNRDVRNRNNIGLANDSPRHLRRPAKQNKNKNFEIKMFNIFDTKVCLIAIKCQINYFKPVPYGLR